MIKSALLPSGLRFRSETQRVKSPPNSRTPQSVSSTAEIVANKFDVLLGRGKGSYEWEGNARYQQVISYYLPTYVSTSKKNEKTQISIDVVSSVKRAGGRFLKENRGRLCEVPDKEARDKVAQALRHRRRAYENGNSSYKKAAVLDRKMLSIPSSVMGCSRFLDDASGRTDDTEPVVSERSDYTRHSNSRKPISDERTEDDDWRSLEELAPWEDCQPASQQTVEWQCPAVPLSFHSGSTQHCWPSIIRSNKEFSLVVDDSINNVQYENLLNLPEAECGSDISSEFSLLDIDSVNMSDDDGRMSF